MTGLIQWTLCSAFLAGVVLAAGERAIAAPGRELLSFQLAEDSGVETCEVAVGMGLISSASKEDGVRLRITGESSSKKDIPIRVVSPFRGMAREMWVISWSGPKTGQFELEFGEAPESIGTRREGAPDGNLLPNGGFEQTTLEGHPAFWETRKWDQCTIDREAARFGKHALAIHAAHEKGVEWAGVISDFIPVAEGVPYRFSGWMRISGDYPNAAYGYWFFYGGDKSKEVSPPRLAFVRARKSDWIYFTTDEFVPPLAKFARVTVSSHINEPDRAWFDGLRVERMGPLPPLLGLVLGRQSYHYPKGERGGDLRAWLRLGEPANHLLKARLAESSGERPPREVWIEHARISTTSSGKRLTVRLVKAGDSSPLRTWELTFGEKPTLLISDIGVEKLPVGRYRIEGTVTEPDGTPISKAHTSFEVLPPIIP